MNPRIDRFTVRDAIVNVALYLPLGMAGYLALRGRRRIWGPIAGGLLLSCTIEIVQLYEPTRNTSGLDVVTNVAGTVLGLFLGMLFEKIAGPVEGDLLRKRVTDRAALSLVFVWAGYLVFPFFPIVGSYLPGRKMRVFLDSALFAPVALLSAAAAWFAAGRLLRAAGFRKPPLWLALSVLAVPLQFFIVDRQPVPSDVLGAVAGLLLFLWLGRDPRIRRTEAVVFLIIVLVRGLAPFRFSEISSPFDWIPFGGFLNTQWQQGILILLEKGFWYGTAIWLLRSSGLRLWSAAALVAATLAAIEAAQIHLPGRTAEITDPVLAILMGFGLRSLRREAK